MCLTQHLVRNFKKLAKSLAYRFDHPDLTIKECAAKLGVPYDTYHGWLSDHKNKGENAFRGSGNYSSDEAK